MVYEQSIEARARAARRKATILALIVTIALAYLVASPYIALYFFGQAVKSADADRLADMIDFPAVRESLKASFSVAMMQNLQKSNNPFAALGYAIESPLVNSMIDNMVTPHGIVAMLQTGRVPPPNSATATETDAPSNVTWHAYYVSWDRFALVIGDSTNSMQTRFCRHALVSWKLCDITFNLQERATSRAPTTFAPGTTKIAEILTAVQRNDRAVIMQYFDDTAQATMTAANVGHLADLLEPMGPVQTIDDTTPNESVQHTYVAHFAGGTWEVMMPLDVDGKGTGFYVRRLAN